LANPAQFRERSRSDPSFARKADMNESQPSFGFLTGFFIGAQRFSGGAIASKTYGPFPPEAILEIMKVASELLDSGHVAA